MQQPKAILSRISLRYHILDLILLKEQELEKINEALEKIDREFQMEYATQDYHKYLVDAFKYFEDVIPDRYANNAWEITARLNAADVKTFEEDGCFFMYHNYYSWERAHAILGKKYRLGQFGIKLAFRGPDRMEYTDLRGTIPPIVDIVHPDEVSNYMKEDDDE